MSTRTESSDSSLESDTSLANAASELFAAYGRRSKPAPPGRNALDVVVYGPPDLTLDETDNMSRAAGGIVLSGRSGLIRARQLRQIKGYQGRLWFDPALYKRGSRASADVRARLAAEAAEAARQTEDALDSGIAGLIPAPRQELGGRDQGRALSHAAQFGVQRRLGVSEPLTAPTRIVPAGDLSTLQEMLDDPSWPLDARVVLPLDSAWLAYSADLLVEEIWRVNRPVAIALPTTFDSSGHPSNSVRRPIEPLGRPAKIEGLLALAESGLDLMLLGAGPAGIGAVIHGFRSAALDVRRSVFLPALGEYHDPSTLRAMQSLGSARLDGLDYCPCQHCRGRSLTRFAHTHDIDESWASRQIARRRADREATRAHNLAALLDLVDGLRDEPARTRRHEWRDHCARAISYHEWLRDNRRVDITPPRSLIAWAQHAATDRAATR